MSKKISPQDEYVVFYKNGQQINIFLNGLTFAYSIKNGSKIYARPKFLHRIRIIPTHVIFECRSKEKGEKKFDELIRFFIKKQQENKLPCELPKDFFD